MTDGGKFCNEARSIVDEIRVDVFCSLIAHEQLAACGFMLVVLADRGSRFSSVEALPTPYEPRRVSEPAGHRIDGLGYWLTRSGPGGELPQDCVHEPGSLGVSGCTHELHAFAEGCMRRYAVHITELECAHSQRNVYLFRECLVGTVEQLREFRVERNLPAQNAHHQGGCEISVSLRQLSQRLAVEKIIAVCR